MGKVFFTITVLVFSTVIFSQNVNKQIIIADSIDNEAVEFSYITDSEGVIYGVSNSIGEVKIKLDKNNLDKELYVIRSGYKKHSFRVGRLKDTIFLQPNIEHIKEVTVTAEKGGTIYYKYYFKTYDTQNDTIRRYIDGIVEYAVNKKKSSVKQKILEYRSFINKKVFKDEKLKFIEISYEGTGVLNYKLMSIYDISKLYNDYILTSLNRGSFKIKDRGGEEIGKIYLDNTGKEKSAYLLEVNNSDKTKKFLGSEGKILFELEEEHFSNTTDDKYYLSKRRFVQKALFSPKSKKGSFSTYMAFSELFFLGTYNSSKYKGVKFRRDNSNYHDKFWTNNEYIAVSKPLVNLKMLEETQNKN